MEKVDHGWFGTPLTISTATTSYAVPNVTDVANCMSCAHSGSAPGHKNKREFTTHGNQDVYLTGDNFGPLLDPSNACAPADPGDILVQYKNELGYSYMPQVKCQVVTAHTQIKCKTMPGVSHNFVWTVSVAGQISPPSSGSPEKTTFYK